jgi:SAM-dependent methyltransferase
MDDRTRLIQEYERRTRDERYTRWYASDNLTHAWTTRERDCEIDSALNQYIGSNMAAARVLDIGCGHGDELSRFLRWQTLPQNLHGVELIWKRVTRAKKLHPYLQLQHGDACNLPYALEAFDLVFQFTVFTSILDRTLRQQMASEMLRVLKPRGLILWYDFRWNPMNRQTRGIGMQEIEKLFPQCLYDSRRLTLAPPLARLVVPYPALYSELNRIAALKSHYLVAIRRRQREAAL